MAHSPQQLGDAPHVNLQIVKDWQHREDRKEPTCAFRIHMDVSIDASQVPALEGWLSDDNLKRVFEELTTTSPAVRTMKAHYPRAWAMFTGALGVKE